MSELGKVIEDIESCNYECEAGPLTKHVGWNTLIAAAKRAEQAEAENRSLSRTCEMMLRRNDILEEEVVSRSRNHADVVKTYHEKLKSTDARRASLLAAVDRIREQLEDSQVADENEGDYGERIELLMGIVKEVL